MEIYLIRHTSVKNPNKLCYGHFDIDLADSFLQEKEKIHQFLDNIRFNQIYTSPSTRCLKLAKSFNQTIITNDLLKELHFGDWEGEKWDSIHKVEMEKWSEDYVKISPPNGESYQQLYNRNIDFWNDMIQNSSNSDTNMIITHAGVIRALLCHILEMPLQNAFQLAIDYGKVTKIEITSNSNIIKYLNII